MAAVEMKELLEAGLHFGHQTKRWNPKMARYIFGERHGIYIIDLKKTVRKFSEACRFVRKLAAEGESILFIGTKPQAQEIVSEEARRCGMYYVNHRWLGGMLTNFTTIKQSIKKLKRLEGADKDGTYDRLPKKEVIKLEKMRVQLDKTLGGIKEMGQLPGAVFIIDTINEKTALLESRRLGIPVIAIVDTNCDPDDVDFVIPGNDDGIRSIRLVTHRIAEAVLEGQLIQQKEAEKAAAIAAEAKARVQKKREAASSPPEPPAEALDEAEEQTEETPA